MKRRIALLAGAGLSLATATMAHAQSAVPTGKERVVIQVSTPEQRLWNQAFNYLTNLREVYGDGNVELEIVALGLGIGVLQLESTQGPRAADALQAGVHLVACEISMRRQKLKREDMLPNIGFVPAGLGQIIKRQREGWAYISG